MRVSSETHSNLELQSLAKKKKVCRGLLVLRNTETFMALSFLCRTDDWIAYRSVLSFAWHPWHNECNRTEGNGSGPSGSLCHVEHMSAPSFHGESLRHACVTIHWISAKRPGLVSVWLFAATFRIMKNTRWETFWCFFLNISFYTCDRCRKHCLDDLCVNAVHCSQFNGVLLLLFDVTLHSCHLHFPTAAGRETSQRWIRLQ